MVMTKAWYTKIESSIIWLEDVLEGPMDIVDLLLHFNTSVKQNIGRGERAELLTKRSFSQMQGFECNWQLSVIKINELKPSCPQWQPREFCDFKIHVDVNRTIFHQNAFCFWCWLDLKAFLKSIELESKQETNSWSKKAKRQQKTLKINNISFPPFFIYQQKQKGTKLYNFAIHSYNQAELLLGGNNCPKRKPRKRSWVVLEGLWGFVSIPLCTSSRYSPHIDLPNTDKKQGEKLTRGKRIWAAWFYFFIGWKYEKINSGEKEVGSKVDLQDSLKLLQSEDSIMTQERVLFFFLNYVLCWQTSL